MIQNVQSFGSFFETVNVKNHLKVILVLHKIPPYFQLPKFLSRDLKLTAHSMVDWLEKLLLAFWTVGKELVLCLIWRTAENCTFGY